MSDATNSVLLIDSKPVMPIVGLTTLVSNLPPAQPSPTLPPLTLPSPTLSTVSSPPLILRPPTPIFILPKPVFNTTEVKIAPNIKNEKRLTNTIESTSVVKNEFDVPQPQKPSSKTRAKKQRSIRTVHTCPECDFSTNYRIVYLKHLPTHENLRDCEELKELLSCSWCSYTSLHEDNLKNHVTSQHPSQTAAPNNVKTNRSVSVTIIPNGELISQFTINDQPCVNKDGKLLAKCNLCGLVSESASFLRSHIKKKHPKPFRCTVCNTNHPTKGRLEDHLRVHSDVKPYRCNICNYACRSRQYLANHRRTHTGERPFECRYCDAAFANCGGRKTHTMQKHTGERPFMCDVCSAAFVHNSDLRTHMRIHTGEKPYKCKLCDAAFKQSNNLNKHKLAHRAGEEMHRCSLCDAKFFRKGLLTRHMRTAHADSEQPYRCKQCDVGFSRSEQLASHKRRHPKPPVKCDSDSKDAA